MRTIKKIVIEKTPGYSDYLNDSATPDYRNFTVFPDDCTV